MAFDAVVADIDESLLVGPDPATSAARIARAKYDALAETPAALGRLLLTADTMVGHDGQPLGKPSDRAHAESMLLAVSGATLDIASAVCFGRAPSRPESRVVVTRVTLRELDPAEIRDYVESGAADDKAGALELQGRAGNFMTSVDGCWPNVVGLPTCVVEAMLRGDEPAAVDAAIAMCSGAGCGVERQ